MPNRTWCELETLETKLDRLQTSHMRILSQGNSEDARKAQMQINAVMTERDRVMQRLMAKLSMRVSGN